MCTKEPNISVEAVKAVFCIVERSVNVSTRTIGNLLTEEHIKCEHNTLILIAAVQHQFAP